MASRRSEADDDLVAALALAPVWRRDPNDVPDEVAEVFAEHGSDLVAVADAWHGPALALAAHLGTSDHRTGYDLVVELLRHAVSATPAAGVGYGQCLSNLAMALQRRFERCGEVADIGEAVTLGRRAVREFQTVDPDRVVPLAALAGGDATDADEAVTLARRSVTGVNDPRRAARLVNLAAALQSAHVVLCWLALLLIRVAETTTGQTWHNIRRERHRLHAVTFTGPTGTFRQTTEPTKPQLDLYTQLRLPLPKKIIEITAPSP